MSRWVPFGKYWRSRRSVAATSWPLVDRLHTRRLLETTPRPARPPTRPTLAICDLVSHERVHPVLGLRPGDPQGAVLHQRDRVAERPLPASCESSRPLPDRAGRDEMPVPGHPIPRPERDRSDTMGCAVEASPERLRHHLRRPDAGRRATLIMKPPLHRYQTDPARAVPRVRHWCPTSGLAAQQCVWPMRRASHDQLHAGR
jgi:hypothetical protein